MKIKQAIILISITLLIVSYLTGVFQFAVFGDFTSRLGTTFNIQEDGGEVEKLVKARWEVVHFIDQF